LALDEVVDLPPQARGVAPDRVQQVALVRAEPSPHGPLQEAQPRLDRGEGRPQFVRDRGDEGGARTVARGQPRRLRPRRP